MEIQKTSQLVALRSPTMDRIATTPAISVGRVVLVFLLMITYSYSGGESEGVLLRPLVCKYSANTPIQRRWGVGLQVTIQQRTPVGVRSA